MYQYRQASVSMRQGDSDRQIAAARIMGKRYRRQREAEQHTIELVRLNSTIKGERVRHQQEAEALNGKLADLQTNSRAQAVELASLNSTIEAERMVFKEKAKTAEQTQNDSRQKAEHEALRTTEQIAKIKADRETARQEMSKARAGAQLPDLGKQHQVQHLAQVAHAAGAALEADHIVDLCFTRGNDQRPLSMRVSRYIRLNARTRAATRCTATGCAPPATCSRTRMPFFAGSSASDFHSS